MRCLLTTILIFFFSADVTSNYQTANKKGFSLEPQNLVCKAFPFNTLIDKKNLAKSTVTSSGLLVWNDLPNHIRDKTVTITFRNKFFEKSQPRFLGVFKGRMHQLQLSLHYFNPRIICTFKKILYVLSLIIFITP